MMTPLAYYNKNCREGVLKKDSNQVEILTQFDHIFAELIAERKRQTRLWGSFTRRRLVIGLYLWGSVGVGKTALMDAFYQCLPFKNKLRIHFHNFMAMIHESLKSHQGQKNPINAVADDIAKQSEVLCFDELVVSDIADAMLLARLFEALFVRGVCLVATSNIHPDKLYENGLQRELFLPAVELLKLNTKVMYIPSKMDYRMQRISRVDTYFTPLNKSARDGMEKMFNRLRGGDDCSYSNVTINSREVPVVAHAEKVIWFNFRDICAVPRCQQDYLVIAENYTSVLVSDIPVITAEAKDMICLFVTLVDVLYDARVRLVISAAESADDLYRRGFMILEYARTHSRLKEMQSSEYFKAEDWPLELHPKSD